MGQLTTPTYGWPYPDPSDPTKDGATRIGNLAKAIDTSVKNRLAAYLVHGASSVVTTNSGGAATVTFPTPFAAGTMPGISITCGTTAQDSMQPQAFLFTSQVNSTYFTAYVKNQNPPPGSWIQSTAVRLFWTAIGPIAAGQLAALADDGDAEPAEPFAEAVPPPWLAHCTPAELAAFGTVDNPWPAPPDDWA
jgi:hypothetical protein